MKRAAVKPDAAPPRLSLVYEDLDELLKRKHPDNAKEHDLELLEELMGIYGFTNPVGVDDNSGLVAFGHGRLDRLAETRDAGRAPPKNIEVDAKGRWLVPTIHGNRFDDEQALMKYLIADNRATERGGWRNQDLVATLSKIGKDNLRGTGFNQGDFVTFLARLGQQPKTGRRDAEDVPDLPKRAITKPGQLWQLGDHRLLCGDTTDPAAIKRLVADAVLVLIHADPPYGMGKEAEGIENDNLYEAKLDEFQMKWWRAWRAFMSDVASAYVWGLAPDLWRLWWRHLEPLTRAEKDPERLTVRNEIVWDKGSGIGMRTAGFHSFPPATERCLFFMLGQQFLGNQNKEDFWAGYEPLRAWLEAERDKAGWTNRDVNHITQTQMAGHWFTQSQFIPISRKHYEMLQLAAKGLAFKEDYEDLFGRLFPDARTGGNQHRRDLAAKLRESRTFFDNTHDAMTDVWDFSRVVGEERFGHATPKPVAMVARALKSSSPVGGVIGVPFAGTGPEFIAAEQWERRVVGMEIKPEYCDIIVERWQGFTGGKARLVRS